MDESNDLVLIEVLREHRPGRGRWWKPGGRGYTDRFHKAGLFERARAEVLIGDKCRVMELTEPPKEEALKYASVIAMEVVGERSRQIDKWGVADNPDGRHRWQLQAANLEQLARCSLAAQGDSWAAILMEEVAEAIQAADASNLREELVQVAAVAVAWIAHIDRTRALLSEDTKV